MLQIFEEFIDHYFEGKTDSGKKQAIAALKHWENHINQEPYQVDRKDVVRFIRKLRSPSNKDRLGPRTLSIYLLYIAQFYEYLDSTRYTTLVDYIMEKSRRLGKQVAQRSGIDLWDAVEMLMAITELSGKLLIRLLVFSKIPIGCLNSLRVREIYNKRKYRTYCNGKAIEGDLYSDTPEIIDEYKKENKLKPDDRLVNISVRLIQYLIPKYAKGAKITKRVTPRDLKEFGKNPKLRRWLIAQYEEAKKKSKKKKSN